MSRRNSLAEILTLTAIGKFNTGDTVTISLYDRSDGSVVTLSANACTEIGATGLFTWPYSSITTAPTILTEYVFEMSNGSSIQTEVDTFGGWTELVGGGSLIPADMCKVFANIQEPSDAEGIEPTRLHSSINKTHANIQGTYYNVASAKFFTTENVKPSYDQLTGQAYWIFPQGSSVKFFIKQLGINEVVTIPAASTSDLNDLLA